jgi:hypothetical protein
MHDELTKLKDEVRRLTSAALGRIAGGPGVPAARLRAIRIRARIFLDTHRRALPREEALGLRAMIERLDRAIDVSEGTLVRRHA